MPQPALQDNATKRAPLAEPAPPDPPQPSAQDAQSEVLLEELLVEEVSIDGMCGVY